MKIKINDYVRTKSGYICKIININDFREPSMKYGVEASYLKDIMFIGDEDIIKTSPRIIDLIEVGDYVNGRIVDDYIYLDKLGLIGLTELEKEDEKFIKSIVTKKMFEQMVYEIPKD